LIRLPVVGYQKLFTAEGMLRRGALLSKAGFVLLLFLFCWCLTLSAQVKFGVTWNPPKDSTQLERQLLALKQMNITYLQLPPSLEREQLEIIERFDFNIFIKPAYKFLITNELIRRKNSIRDSLEGIIKTYGRYESVKAIGLIEASQTNRDKFGEHLMPLVKSWRQLSNKPLFISMVFGQEYAGVPIDFIQHELYHIPDSLSSGVKKSAKTLMYNPADVTGFDQQSFRNILEFAKKENTPDILFLSFSWLAERLSEGDKIVSIIENYSSDPEAKFAIDKKTAENNQNSGLILLFIMLIGSTAIHYRYNSMYQRLLFRYFSTHSFFVNDVAEWRIRTSAPGLIIMIQNAIAGGILLQMLAEYVVPSAGWEVLIHYFYPLKYIYASLPVLSLCSSLGIFAIELLTVLWMYLTNQSVRHINQVVLLYGWPLQINILVCGAALTIYQANMWEGYVILLAGAYVLIWLIAYLAAIMDMSSFTKKKRGVFMILTLGIGILTLVGISYYLINTSSLQVLQLALGLK